jgi:ABC-type transport system substrate-binding protein
MTAEDVTYSIERLMSMNATPTAKFLNEHSVSIQALSDDTVMFNLDTPFLRDALELSLALPGAYILNSDIVNARPDDFWLVPGMCVGSYYVDQYKPNEMLGLVRNDDYYGPLSDVQVWEFLDGYRTPQDQCDLFETGQVDLAYVDEETYNSPDCAPDFERGVYSLPEYGDFVAQLRERGASLDEENAALLEWVYPGPVYLLVTPEGQSKLQQPAYADSWACVCRFIPFLC